MRLSSLRSASSSIDAGWPFGMVDCSNDATWWIFYQCHTHSLVEWKTMAQYNPPPAPLPAPAVSAGTSTTPAPIECPAGLDTNVCPQFQAEVNAALAAGKDLTDAQLQAWAALQTPVSDPSELNCDNPVQQADGTWKCPSSASTWMILAVAGLAIGGLLVLQGGSASGRTDHEGVPVLHFNNSHQGYALFSLHL